MDTSALVVEANKLLDALEQSDFRPRAAMWVHSSDTDSWRLWIVPPQGFKDRREFYQRVASIITQHRDQFTSVDAADVEMVDESHPAIVALGRMFHVTGRSSIHLSNNLLNGFYLPDGIVLKMAV